ncbi:MAG: hypothetical protein M1830_001102, partial [Pleopsidium flavum]
MRSSSLLTSSALLLASTCLAQNATGNSSVIRIEVGEGGYVFNPASVMAAPGTKIEFDFYPM